MSKRITEKPLEYNFNVVESGANTFTEIDMEFPVAILSRNRVQGVELLDCKYMMPQPDVEPGQSNIVDFQISKSPHDAGGDGLEIEELDNKDILMRDASYFESEDGTGIEQSVSQLITTEQQRFGSLMEKRGKDVIQKNLHVGIKGTGNANAKRIKGRIYYHLIEVDAEELILAVLSDDFSE